MKAIVNHVSKKVGGANPETFLVNETKLLCDASSRKRFIFGKGVVTEAPNQDETRRGMWTLESNTVGKAQRPSSLETGVHDHGVESRPSKDPSVNTVGR